MLGNLQPQTAWREVGYLFSNRSPHQITAVTFTTANEPLGSSLHATCHSSTPAASNATVPQHFIPIVKIIRPLTLQEKKTTQFRPSHGSSVNMGKKSIAPVAAGADRDHSSWLGHVIGRL